MYTVPEKMLGLVKEISFYDFQREFIEYGREKQYSYEGLRELYEYYVELSEDIGNPIEMDVIAICCDWAEYEAKDLFAEFAPYQDMVSPNGEAINCNNAREIWDTANGDEQSELLETLVDRLGQETTVIRIERDSVMTDEPQDRFLVLAF
jgi:hypothetical protein